ncbi:MAG TPA: hypothetical protein DCY27_10895 [Desulfobacterales bacterium]|nr:hypothetical protein [Desulfobacterales bacterium]
MSDQNTLIEAHFADLVKKYNFLALDRLDGLPVVHGLLEFEASNEDIKIQDSFQIRLLIPDDYNKTPPKAYETGGKIPKAFHTYSDDSLCLATPVEIRRKFSETPTLIGFVESLLIPYLFSFSFWKEHGWMPYGELAHGPEGIIQYYLESFKVDSEIIVLKFLKLLAMENYRGHHECPCGSGSKIRNCHGELILRYKGLQSQADFLDEYIRCLDYVITKTGKDFIELVPDEKSRKIIKQWINANNKIE